MMDGMMPGMMLARGVIWLLVVIVLILAAAALIKYRAFGSQIDNCCSILIGRQPLRNAGKI
jgi:hypothetical protein